MPNWVDNNVKIKGSKENIKKFSEALDKTMEMTNYSSEDKEVRSYVRICESIFPQPEVQPWCCAACTTPSDPSALEGSVPSSRSAGCLVCGLPCPLTRCAQAAGRGRQ